MDIFCFCFFWGGVFLFLFVWLVGLSRQGFAITLDCPGTISCRPGWPQTHRDPPASASQVLGLKVCTATTQILVTILKGVVSLILSQSVYHLYIGGLLILFFLVNLVSSHFTEGVYQL